MCGRRPDDRLYTCVMRVLIYLTQLGVWLSLGFLCVSNGFIVDAFGLVLLGLHCFLQLLSARLIVVVVPGCCWGYSCLSVCC